MVDEQFSTQVHITDELSANSTISSDNTNHSSVYGHNNNLNSNTHMHEQNLTRCLSFGCLNTCGLKNRLNYPEFTSLIRTFDFFAVTETKLDCYDTINISGYTFLHQTRRQKFFRRSGGMGVFVKNVFSDYVSVVEHESDYIFWIQLDKSFTKTDKNVYYGVTYVPPVDSRFRNSDEMEQLELEITDMCISHKYVYLVGDYNSRTSNNADYLIADDELARLLEYDDVMIKYFNKSSCLSDHGLSVERANKDMFLNNDGRFLLDICKSNNIFILNGRCGQDKGIGAFTFKDISTIDYSLSSFEGLKFISDFSVQILDPLFTDGHSLLNTVYKFEYGQFKQKLRKPLSSYKYRWKEENKNTFVQNIDMTRINDMHDELQNAVQNNIADEAFINHITVEISDIFQSSAAQTFKTNSNIKYQRDISDKPWYGFKCRNARLKYMKARKFYNTIPTEQNKEHLCNTSKAYKKQ